MRFLVVIPLSVALGCVRFVHVFSSFLPSVSMILNRLPFYPYAGAVLLTVVQTEGVWLHDKEKQS